MSQSNHTPEERAPEDDRKHTARVNLTAAAAGALASISAAVVASFLGVAGTLIGAALASVVSSIAGAIYTGVLASTHQRVRRTLRRPGGHETDLRELQELRGDLGQRGRRALRRPAVRWLVVGGASLALFLVAISAVTGIEAAISKPLASALGGHQEGNARTSVGAALRGSSKQPQGQAPAPSSTTQSPSSVPPRPSGEPAPSSTTTTPPSSTTTVPPSAPPSTAPPST